MLKKTDYQITKQLLDDAIAQLPSDDFRYTINSPTGNFFYETWAIKDEYRDTVWDKILNTLPTDIGEARIILLEPGKCYQVHADIDDRYHLNLQGDNAYLIDLDSNNLHRLHQDLTWYHMDAGCKHSAANFGRTTRVQLVVRQLLKNTLLIDSIPVRITFTKIHENHARFIFDSTISPWLNRMNKVSAINSFNYDKGQVTFNLEKEFLPMLQKILPENFKIS